ncbi:hypothetical protein DFQ12_0527 [Sphingobacterium detergens]|uniref:Uncharacterized protein n=1 Tax=Sphingobacterium detergens TaxID=1145106 RepID=A0A420BG41_SPHD1|nr:hypothetical protein DFQ12_0527 [Sphingobacterium detergens]
MTYKYKQIKFPLYVKIKKNNKNTYYDPSEPIFIQKKLTGLTFVTIATIFFHSYKKITQRAYTRTINFLKTRNIINYCYKFEQQKELK